MKNKKSQNYNKNVQIKNVKTLNTISMHYQSLFVSLYDNAHDSGILSHHSYQCRKIYIIDPPRLLHCLYQYARLI